MNIITTKNTVAQCSLALLLMFGWQQAQSCEITQNESGRTVFNDCYKLNNPPTLKMPDLQVNSASITIHPGSRTGLDIGFEIMNSGQLGTDESISFHVNSIAGKNTGFDIDTTIYVASEDHRFKHHFDDESQQWTMYSQINQRVDRVDAGDVKSFYFATANSPRFYLRNRDQTYLVGMVIRLDDARFSSAHVMTGTLPHNEIIESNEYNNTLAMECLVYGDNINDLSEILHIHHFHYNNDLNMPLIGPCL